MTIFGHQDAVCINAEQADKDNAVILTAKNYNLKRVYV